jgi:hypothetical protein
VVGLGAVPGGFTAAATWGFGGTAAPDAFAAAGGFNGTTGGDVFTSAVLASARMAFGATPGVLTTAPAACGFAGMAAGADLTGAVGGFGAVAGFTSAA